MALREHVTLANMRKVLKTGCKFIKKHPAINKLAPTPLHMGCDALAQYERGGRMKKRRK